MKDQSLLFVLASERGDELKPAQTGRSTGGTNLLSGRRNRIDVMLTHVIKRKRTVMV